jgi:hypothetical protein
MFCHVYSLTHQETFVEYHPKINIEMDMQFYMPIFLTLLTEDTAKMTLSLKKKLHK